jgi:hypothetical protein
MQNKSQTSIDKEVMPKYTIYDKRPTIGTREVRGESWDMFIVRKLKEYHDETRKNLGND